VTAFLLGGYSREREPPFLGMRLSFFGTSARLLGSSANCVTDPKDPSWREGTRKGGENLVPYFREASKCPSSWKIWCNQRIEKWIRGKKE
jgi:hypothetical protein